MSDYENDSLEAREPEYEYAWQNSRNNECYFGIGSTTPPKDHTAVISVVLILVISICGVLSALSLMNIDVFGDVVQEPAKSNVGVSVHFSPSSGNNRPAGLEGSTEEAKEPETETIPSTGPGSMELHINQIPTNSDEVDSQGISGEMTQKNDMMLDWQDVYDKVIPSVVSIVCSDGYSSSSGTGVIMDDKGYVITNAHVVEDAGLIQVILFDNTTVTAQCLGLDTISDLAVLYIHADGLTAAEFGDSDTLRVGDEVVAIGDPLGVKLRGTMTDGIVSAINRGLEVNGKTMSLLQTNAALNAGNSGGPLVNCYGQVIGIVTMKIGDYASSNGVEGLGFAIPISTVKTVVEQLAEYGYVAGRPDLGLEGRMLSLFYQHYYRMPSGMMITSVDLDSDAATQGIKMGDILVYLNGERITDMETYQNLVNGLEVGQQVSAMIYRSGKEYELTLTVGERHG